VIIVLASLFLFLALYLGLVAGSAYLCYYSFAGRGYVTPAAKSTRNVYGQRRDRSESSGEGWWIILGICSGVLCLFLVKGLFKRQRADSSLRVRVTEREQPILFDFIHRVCRDTRAPRPHRVYLAPDVNAAVFYHSSFLSLFLPTPKNLLIGLGLVNRLNLSEFKAVLAHEFGHFSQSSMKVGSYVYMSNRIVADIVFGRDWLDHLVALLRSIDFRIALIAWAFTGVLWGVRKALERLFRAINFANSALSRQMEFNADLVAVSVTGSDALVHGLARLNFANDALMQAWHELSAAADHGLYTRDLYYHQTRAAEHLRVMHKNPRLGEPPDVPEAPSQWVQVFEPGDDGAPLMWATHPSNYDREQNAKRHYLRCPIDPRSPWALFQDVETVRERVTLRLYEVNKGLKNPTLTDPATVQAFIDEERAETTYHARYHGMYDGRFIVPGDLDALVRGAPPELADAGHLREAHAQLFDDEFKRRMDAFQNRRNEYSLLSGLKTGALELKGERFSFRDAEYGKKDVERLLGLVDAELDRDLEWLAARDGRAYLVHQAIARQVSEERRHDLEQRYRFHLAVQDIHANLAGVQQHVHAVLAQLEGKHELAKEEFSGVKAALNYAQDTLRQSLEKAKGLRLPTLKNISAGTPLADYLLHKSVISKLQGRSLEGDWIRELLTQMAEVLERTARVHAKSLGGILSAQERLAEEWLASAATLAGPKPDSAESPAAEALPTSTLP
jgi:Zn-dependent protease with chaperone function